MSERSVVFRCDGSAPLGTGHVHRCLTLAAELTRRGWRAEFACRDLPGAPLERIRRAGYRLHTLERVLSEERDRALSLAIASDCGADWLVVDRYATGAEDLQHMGRHQIGEQRLRVLAIDDICEHAFPIDVLLNQNANADQLDYQTRADTQRLLGPRFALVASAYAAARRAEPATLGPCRRLLVFMGGGDAVVAIERVLHALAQLPPDPAREIRVIVGAEAYESRLSDALAALPGARVEHGHPHLVEPLSWADLLITAGGGVAWEACCLGVPMLILSLAPNQELNAAKLHELGAALYAGKTATTSAAELARALGPVISSAERRQNLGCRAWRLVDGLGAQRVADIMEAPGFR
jgi:UDP-2,4-diacetamido-2,4,6-trideoxy-beta-L-altropyranose hydrolase